MISGLGGVGDVLVFYNNVTSSRLLKVIEKIHYKGI